jgi:hypothetical protein
MPHATGRRGQAKQHHLDKEFAMSARPTEFAAAQDTLRNLYRIAPEMARVRHAAHTVDRDPADPHRATAWVGADEADLLPFVAEHELGGRAAAPRPPTCRCAARGPQDSAIRLAAARHGVRIAASALR